jgi:starvation-inducible DNA-binding protein
MDLITAMKKLLATNFAFYLKAQYYHWNVEGPDFKQYHDLLGEIYAEAYSAVDPLAEEIRALGAYSPGSFSRFMELTDISDENTIPSAMDMLSRLAIDNATLLNSIETAYELAEADHHHGLSNVLAERQDAHKKIGWMLRATLKSNNDSTSLK